ncbi:MAG TPA: RES family NAD+ phosphorylase [Thermoanaerobaculia bacterium]|nr:RES family NAD+ phosphorylase [Thermoanaerobaculia bacterium]
MRPVRQFPTLSLPPDAPSRLADFPSRVLPAGSPWFRVVRKGRGPWWFGGTMDGRFDLPEPHGTCYLAADPVASLLEILGPERNGGIVASEFLAERRIRELQVPEEVLAADVTSRRASRFGITAEIGTLVPYERPQAWAASLFQAGFRGILYWLRHDPARSEALALFGPHGERKTWKRGRERAVSGELIRRLRTECGIEVVPIPRSNQLRIIDET